MNAFPGPSLYWSATSHFPDNPDAVWIVNFGCGNIFIAKDEGTYVRAVR